VAEGGGLLNRYTVISRIVGSNPIPSAILLIESMAYGRIFRYGHHRSHQQVLDCGGQPGWQQAPDLGTGRGQAPTKKRVFSTIHHRIAFGHLCLAAISLMPVWQLLAHSPFTAVTGVRIPLGTPIISGEGDFPVLADFEEPELVGLVGSVQRRAPARLVDREAVGLGMKFGRSRNTRIATGVATGQHGVGSSGDLGGSTATD
jgi:hypothetical protein